MGVASPLAGSDAASAAVRPAGPTGPEETPTPAEQPVQPRGGARYGVVLRDLALPAVGLLVAVALWWIATHLLVLPGSFLARFAPDRAVEALGRLVSTGQLWPHLLTSFRRVAVGLAIAAGIGLPLGLAVGSLPLFARASGPVFQFVRMVSPLSWTPLAIILLGVGDRPVYFLIAIGGVWPIVLNTSAGVAALDRRWVTVGRSLGGTSWEILRTIVWPGIRPNVLTGLRLAVGLAWIILVPAEMLGVNSGLGYFILNTRDRLAYADLMAAILVVGVCGVVLDAGARWLFRDRRRTRAARTGSAPPPATSRTAGPPTIEVRGGGA